jgi:hypothetical protein
MLNLSNVCFDFLQADQGTMLAAYEEFYNLRQVYALPRFFCVLGCRMKTLFSCFPVMNSSVAKYCVKKLPTECAVLAVSNGTEVSDHSYWQCGFRPSAYV